MELVTEDTGKKKTYDNFGVGVEIVVWLALTKNLVDVDIHSSIVIPVIGQRDDEMDVVCFRGSNDVVFKSNMRNLTNPKECRAI